MKQKRIPCKHSYYDYDIVYDRYNCVEYEDPSDYERNPYVREPVNQNHYVPPEYLNYYKYDHKPTHINYYKDQVNVRKPLSNFIEENLNDVFQTKGYSSSENYYRPRFGYPKELPGTESIHKYGFKTSSYKHPPIYGHTPLEAKRYGGRLYGQYDHFTHYPRQSLYNPEKEFYKTHHEDPYATKQYRKYYEDPYAVSQYRKPLQYYQPQYSPPKPSLFFHKVFPELGYPTLGYKTPQSSDFSSHESQIHHKSPSHYTQVRPHQSSNEPVIHLYLGSELPESLIPQDSSQPLPTETPEISVDIVPELLPMNSVDDAEVMKSEDGNDPATQSPTFSALIAAAPTSNRRSSSNYISKRGRSIDGRAYGADAVGSFNHHTGTLGPFGFYANFYDEK